MREQELPTWHGMVIGGRPGQGKSVVLGRSGAAGRAQSHAAGDDVIADRMRDGPRHRRPGGAGG